MGDDAVPPPPRGDSAPERPIARYGNWAQGVDDPDVATALMALGVAAGAGSDYRRWRTVEEIAAGLRDVATTKAAAIAPGRSNRMLPWPWTDPRVLAGGLDELPGAALWAQAWSRLDGVSDVPLAMRVAEDTDLTWLTRMLREVPAYGGGMVRLAVKGGPAWRFPLRVGFFPDDRGRGLCADLVAGFAASSWQASLISPVVLGPTTVSCDLLVLDDDPWEVPTRLLSLDQVRAGAVLVAHDLATIPGLQVSVIDKIADITGAWAVGFADADPRSWVLNTVVLLSHAFPLDVAAAPAVLGADPDVLLRQTIDQRAVRVADALGTAAREFDVGAHDVPMRGIELPPPADEAFDLAERLRRLEREGRFDREAGDASEEQRLETAAADVLDRSGSARRIQARITEAAAPSRPLPGFAAATAHSVEVRIASPTGPDWLVAPRAFPEQDLAPDRPHRLTVVLTEPALLERPLVADLLLPVVGPSTSAWFTLTTREDTTHVDARIIVLSGNRVLQTARISQVIDDTATGGGVALPELAITPTTSHLEDRREFAAAFVLNRNADGVARATSVVGDQAGMVRLDSETMVNAVEKVTERLAEIVEFPDDFAQLEAAGSVELLTGLAFHGAKLHRALVHDAPGLAAVLQGRPRGLQVVAAKPDAYFPFEFAYAFTSPLPGASLCPRAPAALRDPDPMRDCVGPHGSDVVCPLGFWGLRHVIERHAYQAADTIPADFLVRSSPRRGNNVIHLGAALFAASARVDEVVPGGIAAVVAALEAARPNPVRVDAWANWKHAVHVAPPPSLLLLLTHTVHDDDVDDYGLEIGTDSIELVVDEACLPATPALVLLLGCETALAGDVSYERFPSLFRLAGAPVVVATLTEVLGRHAAPIAAQLVTEVYRQTGTEAHGIGNVLLSTRRRLLAEGLLPVLAIVAFGDADWLVGP